MSELIELVQKHDPGSELIELFEIDLGNGTILYFHSGLDSDLTEIQFRERTGSYNAKTYAAFPIEMSGIELNADGASNRPTLTVANVLNTFSAALGDLKNKDLVGTKVTKRTTLKKYLVGEPGDASPPVEFPIKKYIIDRVASENSIAVEFELSAPFDLSGITLPGRVLVGKYCSWEYQGYERTGIGGCIWKQNSTIEYPNGTGVNSHKAYFTVDDIPIVPTGSTMTGWSTYETYTVWSSATSYSVGDYVEYSNTIWKAVKANSNSTPSESSTVWVRGDLCGKKLSSCKCRFQFKPVDVTTPNSEPSTEKDTTKVLPFGAFPGSMKFR